tara:strand:- start:1032 stop:1739 length:708 start_codon:yes stop_codon:yes gene_type:complete
MKISSTCIAVLVFTCFFQLTTIAQSTNQTVNKNGYKVEEFTHKDLKEWETFGLGSIEANHGQTIMHETKGSLGYMIVSSEIYKENVIVSYDVMTLNPATVLIVEMAAHNNDHFDLKLDASYDGNVKYLFENINMYMFAFHNAAHNKNGPFVRKYPKPGTTPLSEAKKNVLDVGKYHHVEIGMEEGKIWFKVDGKKIFKVKDATYHKGGKVIFRIRGTGHELASCIIKNLKIYSEK